MMDSVRGVGFNSVPNISKELQSFENDGATQESFKSYLENSVSEVNKLIEASDKQAVELATGKSENLHQATIAAEKAETALKLLIQVRNKVIDAYQEIMRMQL